MSQESNITLDQFLDRLARMPGMRSAETRLTVRIANPGGLSGSHTVSVVDAHLGFDWEARQLVLQPALPLTTLSADDVEAIRKSAAGGQSWHAYQQHKDYKKREAKLLAEIARLSGDTTPTAQTPTTETGGQHG
jgi:hypothetical protein